MTKVEIQRNQLRLIMELDGACECLGVSYVLLGRTAYLAQKDGVYKRGSYDFDVAVLADDAGALVDMLASGVGRAIEARTVESGANRECFRYVDTGTTLYDKRDPELYARKNVGINIVPAFKSKNVAISRLREVSRATSGSGFRGILRRFHTSSSPAKVFLYNDLGDVVGISPDAINTVTRVAFEGLPLPVPADMGAHLRECYGEGWKRVVDEPLRSVNSVNVIHLPDTPYEDFVGNLLDDGIDFEKYIDDLECYWAWKRETHDPLMARSSRALEAGNLTVDRIDMFLDYQGRLPELRSAYRNGDADELERLMRPYLDKTERYKKKKLGFYVSDELFGYAKEVWRRQGRDGYAREVEKLVPDYYRKCDLEEYLADYIKR